MAALAVFRGAQACDFELLRKVLQDIAHDEANHAALAWRTVEWALSVGGEPVAAGLRAAAETHRPDPGSDLKPHDTAATLGAHGRLTPRGLQRAEEDAWRGLILPTLTTLLGRGE